MSAQLHFCQLDTDVLFWLQSVSLVVMCQLSCRMLAQVQTFSHFVSSPLCFQRNVVAPYRPHHLLEISAHQQRLASLVRLLSLICPACRSQAINYIMAV
jgi:hypothetical protein